MFASKNTIAIPPGATIREQLENRYMKQKEFAQRMGLSEKHISQLINGHVELTKDVALKLESVLGIPASFWNNLECIYREKITRVDAENKLEKDIELAPLFPYSNMVKFGWVEEVKKSEEKVFNLRNFFEVSELSKLSVLHTPGIAYRRAGVNEKSDYILAAWTQKARIEARKLEAAPINIQKLEQEIPRIREMTLKSPEVFCNEIVSLFAECGIVLVFLPHIGGSYLHGASFRDGNRIVMGLTVRGKYADKFWFSLFHELCHIICGHIGDFNEIPQDAEAEADEFASDTLIPVKQYQSFIEAKCFTKEGINVFASKIGIAPGIVLGRLQKENYVPYDRYNEMKIQYNINY